MAKILAKDAIPGMIYATRGGICNMPDGKKLPWGFDRIRVLKTTGNYVICEASWNVALELPPNYTLYETNLQTISTQYLFKLATRKKEDTIELTYDEALEKEYITEKNVVPTGSNPSEPRSTNELQRKLISELEKDDGCTLRDLAMTLNETYQKVRYFVLKLPELGYELQKNGPNFKIVRKP